MEAQGKSENYFLNENYCFYLKSSVEHLLSSSASQQVNDHLFSILLFQKHHMPTAKVTITGTKQN